MLVTIGGWLLAFKTVADPAAFDIAVNDTSEDLGRSRAVLSPSAAKQAVTVYLSEPPYGELETWQLSRGFGELSTHVQLVTDRTPELPPSWQRWWVIVDDSGEPRVIPFANPKEGVRRFLSRVHDPINQDFAMRACLATVLLHLGPDLVDWNLKFAGSASQLEEFCSALPVTRSADGSVQVRIEIQSQLVAGEAAPLATQQYVFSFDVDGTMVDWTANYTGSRFE